MKNFIILFIVFTTTLFASFSFKPASRQYKEPIPPSGYTGAPTQSRTCINCHGDFLLNMSGGSVYATGLPNGSYTPGQSYNFSITIKHGTPMQLWGFAIKAVVSGTSGTALGTFSTTNPNATVASGELKNNNSVSFNGSSYTYNNLTWTAPSTGGSLVSFYMSGVACDADGSESGDYVYSSSLLSVPVPVSFGEITGKLVGRDALISWTTYSESGSAHFELERSGDGTIYERMGRIAASGNSNSTRTYAYADQSVPLGLRNLYYRLKMVDQDGNAAYSKTIVLKMLNKGTYIENLFPAVLGRNETLELQIVSEENQRANIAIFGPNGVCVYNKPVNLEKGMNEIGIGGIPGNVSGVYILQLKAGAYIGSRKLIMR